MNHLAKTTSNLPSRSEALRDDYLNRIFQVLAAAFGTQFTGKWAGTTPDDMKEVWGRKLYRYSDQPNAIAGALNEAIECEFPPNLGEFYLMCQKRYQTPTVVNTQPAIADGRTDEDKVACGESARKSIDEWAAAQKDADNKTKAHIQSLKRILGGDYSDLRRDA